MMRLSITDDGPGIASDLLPRLFEPFVSTGRPHGTRTAGATGGTGLGLMVTRHLVEAAGGSIHVESEPGHGARFVIDLPA
jgi:signal transduction histidine kinase